MRLSPRMERYADGGAICGFYPDLIKIIGINYYAICDMRILVGAIDILEQVHRRLVYHPSCCVASQANTGIHTTPVDIVSTTHERTHKL